MSVVDASRGIAVPFRCRTLTLSVPSLPSRRAAVRIEQLQVRGKGRYLAELRRWLRTDLAPLIREVFARNLRKYRQTKGLSQEALAHEAGIDRTYISALERSQYSASITTVDKVATILGVEAAELLRRPAKPRALKT